jgi:hypothetical protein
VESQSHREKGDMGMTSITRAVVKMLAVVLAVLSVGCQETVTLVTVEPDGSGTILLRCYFNTKAMKDSVEGVGDEVAGEMMSAMGDAMGEAMAGLGTAMGADAGTTLAIKAEIAEGLANAEASTVTMTTETESFYDEAQAKALAPAFGSDVRFIGGKEMIRDDVWKGFQVTYAFDDISKVVVGQDIASLVMDLSMAEDNVEMAEPMVEGYIFTFNRHDGEGELSMRLRSPQEVKAIWMESISPEKAAEYKRMDAEFAAQEAEEEAEEEAEPPTAEELREYEAELVEESKGRKDSILVAVKGAVSSCNGTYWSKRRPQVVPLVHLNYDSILANPVALKAIAEADMIESAEPVDIGVLGRTHGIKGCILEKTTKTVVIRYR